MATHWKPHTAHPCEDGTARTVYIRGEIAPFVGWMATPDTYFSCPAYVRVKGRRVRGFVGQNSEDSGQTFHPLASEVHKLGSSADV
jgi:hypothetical protein